MGGFINGDGKFIIAKRGIIRKVRGGADMEPSHNLSKLHNAIRLGQEYNIPRLQGGVTNKQMKRNRTLKHRRHWNDVGHRSKHNYTFNIKSIGDNTLNVNLKL